MLSAPLYWYVALVIVLGLAAAFVGHIARTGRREWLQSGRSPAEYDERLRRNRRRLLPWIVILAVLFVLGRLRVLPEQLAGWLPLVPVVLSIPAALYELWKDRRRLTQERTWRVNVLSYAVLLVVLSCLTLLVMPFLLSLP